MSYGAGYTGLPVSDTHTIGRFNGTEPATVREYVDYAETYNQAAVVMWHTIGQDPDEVEITESTFRELLDYIENADVDGRHAVRPRRWRRLRVPGGRRRSWQGGGGRACGFLRA